MKNWFICTILICFSMQAAWPDSLVDQIIDVLTFNEPARTEEFLRTSNLKLNQNQLNQLISKMQNYSPQWNWIPVLKKLTQSNPNRTELIFLLSYASYQAGDFEAAMEISERGFESAQDVHMKYQFAAIARTCQKFDAAMQRVDKILEQYPHHPESLFLKANLLTSQGDIDSAETILNDLVQEQPNHAQSLYQLGLIKTRMGENQKAVMYFERAIEAYPFFRQAYAAMRVPLDRLKEKDKLQHVHSIVKIMHEWSADRVQRLQHIYQKGHSATPTEAQLLAMQLNQLGQEQKAKQYLESRNHTTPLNDELKELLAYFQFNAEEYSSAKQLLEQIQSPEIRQKDNYWGIYLWTLFYLDEHEKCMNLFEEKKEKFSDSRHFQELSKIIKPSSKN